MRNADRQLIGERVGTLMPRSEPSTFDAGIELDYIITYVPSKTDVSRNIYGLNIPLEKSITCAFSMIGPTNFLNSS